MTHSLMTFYACVKDVRTELQVFANEESPRRALDQALFQKFLYSSINFVSTQSASNAQIGQVVELADWFSDLSQVIHLQFQHCSDWDSKCLCHKNLISYLSNISHKLLIIQQIPLEWHHTIWLAVFRAMILYLQLPSPEAEFLTRVTQMGYKVLRCAGQKAEGRHKLDKSVRVELCYELYLLGAAIVSLDPTGKAGDGLKLAKGFISTYLRFHKSRNKVSLSSVGHEERGPWATRMLEMAVTVYTAQSRDASTDASLAFYVELFRLVLEDPLLREKLLACAGNLFKYSLSEDTDDFFAVIRTARERFSTASIANETANCSAQGIVVGVLTLVHEMRQICNDRLVISDVENGLQPGLLADVHFAVASMLKKSPGPVSIAVSDCLVVYIHSLPKLTRAKTEFLAACIRINSLSIDVFVRDIFSLVFKQNQTDLACQRLRTLELVTTTNMFLLEIILTRNELGIEMVTEMAELLKSTVKFLHSLTEVASKKKDTYPDLFSKSFPILEKAMADIGIIGRKLTRLGLYSVTITLLAPLWPVKRMEELIPSISHHGALCESYWKTVQLKKAWDVISKAIIIDVNLVSESIIKTLVNILKQETSLSVLKLVEPCQDQIKQAHLLISVVRKLVLRQSLPAVRHSIVILRCLVQHGALSDLQRTPHQVLLAQTLWLEDQENISGECLPLLLNCMRSLLDDTSHQFDDVLAQAAFLYWAVRSAACHDGTSGQGVEVAAESDGPCRPSPVPCDTGETGIGDCALSATARDKAELTMEIRKDEQVHCEFFMAKAMACLELWAQWFSAFGDKLLETDIFRLEISLRFLQRVAELAVINCKAMMAVKALCQAHHVASLLKSTDSVEDIMRLLTYVIPSLGLQWTSVREHSDFDNEENLVKDLSLGQSVSLQNITVAASYYMRTGQLEKFVHARSVAGRIIDGLTKPELSTASFYSLHATLSRLDGEFHFLPSFSRPPPVADEPTSHPLEMVGESLKYIKGVIAFHLGKDALNSTSKNAPPPLHVWPVIHEYLTTLQLYGDLCLHIAVYKYAKTYFTEGLLLARKFFLVAWNAVFSARLLRLTLISQDATSEAEDLLQSTVNLLKKHGLAVWVPTELGDLSGKDLTDTFSSQHLSCIFGAKERTTKCSYCSVTPCEHAVSARQQLLFRDPEPLEPTESENEWKAITPAGTCDKCCQPAGTCDKCFQPEIADLCADLMGSQAEILWRKNAPLWAVVSSLQAAIASAQCLAQVFLEENVPNFLAKRGLNVEPLAQGKSWNCGRMLSAVYQLAEISFQRLYLRGHGASRSAVLETQNLLDLVDREGKKMKGCATSNVTVACSLLLKSHLSYQPLLERTKEAVPDIASDRAAILVALKAAAEESQFWESGSTLKKESSPNPIISSIATNSSDERNTNVGQLSHSRDKTSVSTSSHSRDKTSVSTSSQSRDKTSVSTSGQSRDKTSVSTSSQSRDKTSVSTSSQSRDKTSVSTSGQRARNSCLSNCQHNTANQTRVDSLTKNDCLTEIAAESHSTGNLSSKDKFLSSTACKNDQAMLMIPQGDYCSCKEDTEKNGFLFSSPADQRCELIGCVSGRHTRYSTIPQISQRSQSEVACEIQSIESNPQSPLVGAEKKHKYQKCAKSVRQVAAGQRDSCSRHECSESREMSLALHKRAQDNSGSQPVGAIIEREEFAKAAQAVKRRVRTNRTTQEAGTITGRLGVNTNKDGRITREKRTKARKAGSNVVAEAETMRADVSSDLLYGNIFQEQISAVDTEDCMVCNSRGETWSVVSMTRLASNHSDSDIDMLHHSDMSHSVSDIDMLHHSDMSHRVSDIDMLHHSDMSHRVSDIDMLHHSDMSHRVSDIDMLHHSDMNHLEAEILNPLTPTLQYSAEIPRGRPQRNKTKSKVQEEHKVDVDRVNSSYSKGSSDNRLQVGVYGSDFKFQLGKKYNENLEVKDDTDTLPQTVLQCISQRTNCQQKIIPDLGRTRSRLQELCSPNITSRLDILAPATRRRAQRKDAGKRALEEQYSVLMESPQPEEWTLSSNLDVISSDSKENTSMNIEARTAATRQRARKGALKRAAQVLEAPEQHMSQVRLDVTAKRREKTASKVKRTAVDVDLQTIAAKFPTLAFCQPVTNRIKYLKDALQQLDQFVPSVLHRQVNQSLALCLWERDMLAGTHSSQLEIAAYLTNSMHATFQHQMTKNLCYKLRKTPDPATSEHSKDTNHVCLNTEEIQAMRTALSSLSFRVDVLEQFSDRMASLPADWTVCQLTIVDLDPSKPGQGQVFVSRLTVDQEPLTVGLPSHRWQALQRSMRLYEFAVELKTDQASLREHWTYRHQQDQDMQNLVHYLQELFLGAHKWLLRGQLACLKELAVQKFLKQATKDTVDSVVQIHDYNVSYGIVRNLLEVCLVAPEKDVASLVGCVLPEVIALTVTEAVMRVQKAVLAMFQKSNNYERGSVILILDKALNKFPWESMPDLSLDTVTRLPSFATLHTMLTLHKARTHSPFLSGVVRTSAVAVIPPDTDLQNAVVQLAPQFLKYPGWKCLIQKAPTVSELNSFLTDRSLYLYCGHNWGHQYVEGRDVQLFHGKAVAILMGCSSGKLQHRGKLDGEGGPLYFLMAGCPAVLGNLWNVTDKDIDKLTSCLFSHWMAQTKPISLRQLLSVARKACKLSGVTGFAPVIYGLPVMMNTETLGDYS